MRQHPSRAHIWRKPRLKGTGSPVFPAALVTTAKARARPNVHGQKSRYRTWCGHTAEYYSAIKKDATVPFAETRMDLEIITTSEVSQIETNI